MPVVKRQKSKPIKQFLYLLIVAVLISLITIFLKNRYGEQPTPTPPRSSKASLSLDKISHSATRDGVRQWSLEAASADYFNDENRADLRDLSVTFYTKDGESALLTADNGTLNTETNDITVSNNVVITKETYVVQTERLNYSHEKKLLYTQVPVHLSDNGSSLRGDTMILNLEEDTLEIKGNVKGQFSEDLRL